MLYSVSTYGPLPAPFDAAELNHFSALSVLSAPGRSVAPWARASFEFTIPSDVFATIAGIAGSALRAEHDRVGATRGDGHAAEQEGWVALEVDQPRNEKTTSAAVMGVPSAKRMSRRRSNVYVFASRRR